MCSLRHLLLLLLLVLLTHFNGASPAEVSVHFDLVRHDDHILDVARSDILRQMAVGHRLGRGRRMTTVAAALWNTTSASAFAMPLNSGAYTGVGQYFARFLLGTPAKKFMLVVDTGSELTWVVCKLNATRRVKVGRRLFDPKRSRTFRPITCASEQCTTLPFALTICPSATNSCLYDYLYQQNSVQGSFARESATVILSDNHRRVKLPGITIGCTSSYSGPSFGNYDGVLGLAYTRSSFSSVATPFFGGKFSYCLVDHLSPKNASNYLIFGARRDPEPDDLSYAELNVARPPLDPFYTINVFGISVGEKLLNIPPSVWLPEAGGGVVMDSGSSLTTLVEPAYKAVTSALRASLAHVPRIDMQPFEFCYDWTGMTASVEMPSLVMHIVKHGGKGLVRLVPPVKSYLIDVADNVKCIGFLSTDWPGSSTIGNILQQNHVWEYDLHKRRLGFKPSSCVRKRR